MASPAKKIVPLTFFGNTGLQVSRMGLGSWISFNAKMEPDAAYNLMKMAYAAGINFFDNAEIYSAGESERIMGAAIARGIADGIWGREDLVVTTKLFFGSGAKNPVNRRGLSRKHIVEGMRASLQRMNLPYVDICFCHRPDPYTPMEEVVRAMNHLIDTDQCFYWGTSEWSAAEITRAMAVCDQLGLIRPVSEQSQYSLIHRERVEVEYTQLVREYHLANTIWSPLGSGVLTGKYKDAIPADSRLAEQAWLRERVLGKDNANVKLAERLRVLAEEKLQCTLAQLAIAWCLKNERATVVLLGATSEKQLEENLSAWSVVPKLTKEVMDEIDVIAGNKPAISYTHEFVAGLRDLNKQYDQGVF